jgi:hypothetical protein
MWNTPIALSSFQELGDHEIGKGKREKRKIFAERETLNPLIGCLLLVT